MKGIYRALHNKRYSNERKFQAWERTPEGRRRYIRRVEGRGGYYAIYEKIVDAEEHTLSFRQMIFNKDGRMTESHDKFPNDTGHKIIGTQL